MFTCLIALGSNLGDRAATLDAATAEIGVLAGVTLKRHSRWHPTQPVGCSDNQHEFLNGAALCETSLSPGDLLAALQAIETRHSRQRAKRWANRTLDLDLLLYDDLVLDTAALMLPHPRMSFRRFVLEPAAEIAGQFVHPTIGWTLNQLLQHLDTAADCTAIVSPDERLRRELTERLVTQFPASSLRPQPVAETPLLWPADLTTWVSIRSAFATQSSRDARCHPKLTILLDPSIAGADSNEEIANWNVVCRQTGRGTTLRIPQSCEENMSIEAFAAIQAVWPALGQSVGKRLE